MYFKAQDALDFTISFFGMYSVAAVVMHGGNELSGQPVVVFEVPHTDFERGCAAGSMISTFDW